MPKPKQFLKENKKKSKHAPSVGWLPPSESDETLNRNRSQQRQMNTWQVRNVWNCVRAELIVLQLVWTLRKRERNGEVAMLQKFALPKTLVM